MCLAGACRGCDRQLPEAELPVKGFLFGSGAVCGKMLMQTVLFSYHFVLARVARAFIAAA